MAIRWRIAILLAVITTINYIDRSVFGVVAPVVRGEFGIGDADYGLITSGFLLARAIPTRPNYTSPKMHASFGQATRRNVK